MQIVARELAMEQLYATDFDDAVTIFRRQASGFRVQDDLSHESSVPPRSAADAGRCPQRGLIRLGAALRRIG
ncbi:hypothetical protein NBRC116584_06500 [Hydrogenophaga sp. 5NK40-0174]